MHYSPAALHIPDGFLSVEVAIIGWMIALLMVIIAVRQTRHQLAERQIPIMGVLAAFIFAAQAINFPVAAGTSGHLLGGALAAITMGPWAATLIMTAVVAVQGLLFQDGGLLVMGWNILNMGVFTAFSGYATYSVVRRLMPSRSRWAGAFVGAWLSVEVGAIATAFELAASGTSPLQFGLPAMAGVHALIGLGEAVITAGAVALLERTRPRTLQAGERAPGRQGASFVFAGLLVAIVVAMFSPLASRHPDGLESVAAQGGFLGSGSAPLFRLLTDYRMPFIQNEALATMVAVALGTLVVFLLAWVAGRASATRG